MSAPWRFPGPTYRLLPRTNSERFRHLPPRRLGLRFAAPPPPRAPIFRGRLFALRGASTKRLSQAPGRVCPAPPGGPRGLSSAAALRRGLSSAALVAVAVELEDQLARSRKTLLRGGAGRPFMFPCPARRLVMQSCSRGSLPRDLPPSRVPGTPGLAGPSVTKAATTPNAPRPRPRPAPRTGCLVGTGCPPEPR